MSEVIEGEAVEEAALPAVIEHTPPTLFRTDDPAEIVQRATAVADQLARVLRDRQLTSTISGREHVRVEGWTLLGTMLGVFPVVEWTRPVLKDGQPWGWEARVEARTLAGAVVGAAEAECLRDEKQWSFTPTNKYGKALDPRDDYALRSMAQTRAMSKALRGPLGFVVSLAGFDPTPEEEMTSTAAIAQPPADPFTVMHPSFKDAAAIADALNHLDPSVDWRTTWASATALVYGAEPTKEQRQESVARMSHVAAALTGDGDFPPPTDEQIKVAFANAFCGLLVDVERHELPGADEPVAAEAEQITLVDES